MKKVSAKAIIIGWVVGFVGTMVVSVGVTYWKTGFDMEKMREWQNGPPTSAVLSMGLFSLVFALLAGYVTGKIGKADPMRNARWLAIVNIAVGSLFLLIGVFTQGFHAATAYNILFMVAGFFVTILGGYLAVPEEQAA